jgi:hypothetical protein
MQKSLLTVDSNAKTVKGQKYGFMTGILYLAPVDISGHQVCPMAKTAQCDKACLYTAGRGAMSSVQVARIKRAKSFFENRTEFMSIVIKDINRLVKRAAKKNMVPLVRLNGTSDIRWESVPVTVNGVDYPNLMAVYPEIQFYDYTKIANRRDIPANYDLTFSYSGVLKYQKFVLQAMDQGMRIAAVFRTRASIPAKFMGLQCIDGDNSDIRHVDPKGVIVALYAKGKAKKDTSGFVIDSLSRMIPIQAAA